MGELHNRALRSGDSPTVPGGVTTSASVSSSAGEPGFSTHHQKHNRTDHRQDRRQPHHLRRLPQFEQGNFIRRRKIGRIKHQQQEQSQRRLHHAQDQGRMGRRSQPRHGLYRDFACGAGRSGAGGSMNGSTIRGDLLILRELLERILGELGPGQVRVGIVLQTQHQALIIRLQDVAG